MTYSDYIESLEASATTEHYTCSNCGCKEDEPHLYLHEPTGRKLCQKCLAENIKNDIEHDGSAKFEGYIFQRTGEPWAKKFSWNFGADKQDGDPTIFGDAVADVLESVLMKLNYI